VGLRVSKWDAQIPFLGLTELDVLLQDIPQGGTVMTTATALTWCALQNKLQESCVLQISSPEHVSALRDQAKEHPGERQSISIQAHR
jgi:hypothetical protein